MSIREIPTIGAAADWHVGCSRRCVDSRPNLLDADDDVTQIDAIPAPLLHIPPPAAPRERAQRKSQPPIPPPLPISLKRPAAPGAERVAPLTESDEAWLATLPAETREVLEAARRSSTGWPIAPRIPSAVVTPLAAPIPVVSAELELIDA